MRADRHSFNELAGDDRFDDSVCEEHQSELRSKVLQAFDQSNRETTLVESQHVSPGVEQRNASSNLILSYSAIAVVCLIGFGAFCFYRWNEPGEPSRAEHRPVSDVTIDSRLATSLAEVNAYRDEVSREALFNAIAMCQRDHEGRMLSDLDLPSMNQPDR